MKSITLPFNEPNGNGGSPQILRLNQECHVGQNNRLSVTVSPWPETAWLGASREDIDGEGYKCHGVFYGGPKNLSNGSALLLGSWVDSSLELSPEAIRMIIDRSKNDTLSVYYDYQIAGEWYPLGEAFNVNSHYLAENNDNVSDVWYPVIRYDRNTYKRFSDMITGLVVTCDPTDAVVPNPKRRLPTDIETDSFGQNWTMKGLFDGPELGGVPLMRETTDNITAKLICPQNEMQVDGCELQFHIGNVISAPIKFLSTEPKDGFYRIELSPGISTRMMTFGETQLVESTIMKKLTHFTKLHIGENEMILTGPDIETIWTTNTSVPPTFRA